LGNSARVAQTTGTVPTSLPCASAMGSTSGFLTFGTFRRWESINNISVVTMTPDRPAPTPIPIFAPVDRPEFWVTGIVFLAVLAAEDVVVLVAMASCDVGEKPVGGM
jgi:hypothetical protein